MTNEFAQFGVHDTHRRVSYPVGTYSFDSFDYAKLSCSRLVVVSYLDHPLQSVSWTHKDNLLSRHMGMTKAHTPRVLRYTLMIALRPLLLLLLLVPTNHLMNLPTLPILHLHGILDTVCHHRRLVSCRYRRQHPLASCP